MFSICWFDHWLYGCIKSFCSKMSKRFWVRRSQAAKYCWWKNSLGLAAKVVRLTSNKPLNLEVSYTLAVLALQFARFEHVPVCFHRMYQKHHPVFDVDRKLSLHSQLNCFLDRSVFCLWCLFGNAEKVTQLQTKHFKFLKGSKDPSSLQTILVMCSLVNLFHGIHYHLITAPIASVCTIHQVGQRGLMPHFGPSLCINFSLKRCVRLGEWFIKRAGI